MSRAFKAEIIDNREVAENIHLIILSPIGAAMNPEPGQFYMIQPDGSFDPLLKRPFSVFNFDPEKLSFLVRKRGKGSRLLAGKGSGSTLELIGPLGTPYPLTEKRPLIVAGGMGVASVYLLVRRLGDRADVIYGARTGNELVFAEEIEAMAGGTVLMTDDGSAGEGGTVMNALKRSGAGAGDTTVYACGPEPMIRNVARFCLEREIECYVSLEQNMACGIGSCLGCVVKTRHGYLRVCREGPVFDAGDLLWE